MWPFFPPRSQPSNVDSNLPGFVIIDDSQSESVELIWSDYRQQNPAQDAEDGANNNNNNAQEANDDQDVAPTDVAEGDPTPTNAEDGANNNNNNAQEANDDQDVAPTDVAEGDPTPTNVTITNANRVTDEPWLSKLNSSRKRIGREVTEFLLSPVEYLFDGIEGVADEEQNSEDSEEKQMRKDGFHVKDMGDTANHSPKRLGFPEQISGDSEDNHDTTNRQHKRARVSKKNSEDSEDNHNRQGRDDRDGFPRTFPPVEEEKIYRAIGHVGPMTSKLRLNKHAVVTSKSQSGDIFAIMKGDIQSQAWIGDVKVIETRGLMDIVRQMSDKAMEMVVPGRTSILEEKEWWEGAKRTVCREMKFRTTLPLFFEARPYTPTVTDASDPAFHRWGKEMNGKEAFNCYELLDETQKVIEPRGQFMKQIASLSQKLVPGIIRTGRYYKDNSFEGHNFTQGRNTFKQKDVDLKPDRWPNNNSSCCVATVVQLLTHVTAISNGFSIMYMENKWTASKSDSDLSILRLLTYGIAMFWEYYSDRNLHHAFWLRLQIRDDLTRAWQQEQARRQEPDCNGNDVVQLLQSIMDATYSKSEREGSKVMRSVWNICCETSTKNSSPKLQRFYPTIPIINQDGDEDFTQEFNKQMDNEAKRMVGKIGIVSKIVLPMVLIIEVGMRTNKRTIFPPHVLDFTDVSTVGGMQYVGPHDQSKIEYTMVGYAVNKTKKHWVSTVKSASKWYDCDDGCISDSDLHDVEKRPKHTDVKEGLVFFYEATPIRRQPCNEPAKKDEILKKSCSVCTKARRKCDGKNPCSYCVSKNIKKCNYEVAGRKGRPKGRKNKRTVVIDVDAEDVIDVDAEEPNAKKSRKEGHGNQAVPAPVAGNIAGNSAGINIVNQAVPAPVAGNIAGNSAGNNIVNQAVPAPVAGNIAGNNIANQAVLAPVAGNIAGNIVNNQHDDALLRRNGAIYNITMHGGHFSGKLFNSGGAKMEFPRGN